MLRISLNEMKILKGILGFQNQIPWILCCISSCHNVSRQLCAAALRLLELGLQSAGQELHKFRGQGVVRTTTVWPRSVVSHQSPVESPVVCVG